jgi:hypothetical protein
MAKIHWNPKKLETFPSAMVPGTLHDVDFMMKDSKRHPAYRSRKDIPASCAIGSSSSPSVGH